jgi:hypothetical protein
MKFIDNISVVCSQIIPHSLSKLNFLKLGTKEDPVEEDIA